MNRKQDFGKASEKQAEKYLRAHKHRIIARNYLTRQGEIDLISVLPDALLVFTEVRSRRDCTYGHPVETVDARKQGHIRAAAKHFLYENPEFAGYACRFDVITIVGEGQDAVLEHFQDAF